MTGINTGIPSNLRVPLFFARVDASRANSGQFNQRALIIGQITGAGAAAPNVPVISMGVSDAVAQGGPGSMLHLMTQGYRLNDNFGEVWYGPLSDAEGAVAATGTINFTAAPTATGVFSLYVAGLVDINGNTVSVQLPVTSTMTAANVATALAAAINANSNLPVTAVASGSAVDLTAKNAGLAGNDIDIRVNYLGAAGGEATPAGLAYTISPMSGGATNPSLGTLLANLMDMPFDFIACPYTDTASLNSIQTFLNDTAGRWSWETQVYGHMFTAYRGTFANQVTLGTARNDQHASIMGFYDSPTPNWVWAAALTAVAATSVREDPGLPFQTLPIAGVLAPPLASRFPLTERNTLLYDGISTFTVAQDGTVAIEKLITTYQQNAFGQPDNSYLGVETMMLLMTVLRSLASLVTTKYARVKLGADGNRYAPGQAIVTPSMIKADLVANYNQLEYQGLVQGTDQFAAGLIVQQNQTNPNRVDVLWDGILINQLNIFALLAQFRLSTTQT